MFRQLEFPAYCSNQVIILRGYESFDDENFYYFHSQNWRWLDNKFRLSDRQLFDDKGNNVFFSYNDDHFY